MRHLTSVQALAYLRLGKTIEQWLGTRPDGSDIVLRWIQVGRDPEKGYIVTLFEGFEDARAAQSIYEIYAVESDQDGAAQPVDAAGKESAFSDEEQALKFVEDRLGGARDRFVNQGMIQDEYRDVRGSV
jgi:hypothetical protein